MGRCPIFWSKCSREMSVNNILQNTESYLAILAVVADRRDGSHLGEVFAETDSHLVFVAWDRKKKVSICLSTRE